MAPEDKTTPWVIQQAEVTGRLRRHSELLDNVVIKPELEARLISELRPKPWKVVATVGALVLAVGGLIFQAARYPDRAEYESDQTAAAARFAKVESEARDMDRTQIRIIGQLDRIEQQLAEIKLAQDKLERALRRR